MCLGVGVGLFGLFFYLWIGLLFWRGVVVGFWNFLVLLFVFVVGFVGGICLLLLRGGFGSDVFGVC